MNYGGGDRAPTRDYEEWVNSVTSSPGVGIVSYKAEL